MPVNMQGRPLPEIADPISEEFFAGCARGELLVQRCTQCGHRQHYPRWCCTQCAGPVAFERGTGRGTVHTFTVIRQNHAQPFKSELPYVVAIVDLDEGVRMMANLTDVDPDAVHIGMPVEVHFAADDEGDVHLPFFRPAGG